MKLFNNRKYNCSIVVIGLFCHISSFVFSHLGGVSILTSLFMDAELPLFASVLFKMSEAAVQRGLLPWLLQLYCKIFFIKFLSSSGAS